MEPIDDREAAELTSVEEVAALARQMYGRAPRFGGVIHPTALWQPAAPEGEAADEEAVAKTAYRVLKIESATPKSHHDTFALNLARARADAVVTTGKNLRREPEMTHAFLGSDATRQALAEWRQQRRAKGEPPWSVVLTSGRGLDLDHPLLQGPGQPVLYTSEEGAQRLKEEAAKRQIRVVADPHPDLRRAVAWLQRQGLGTISIEAGPSTSRDLYKPPLMVQELLLSVYDGPLPEALQGGEFFSPEALGRFFSYRSPAYVVSTKDGEWRFCRHV